MPSYFPVTYQPYYPQQYQNQQYQQQQNQPSGILWVGSELEAQSYPVAPNNAVALWDSSKPAVYLKQADASGRPVMKVFDLTERSVNASQAQTSKNTDYALKSEIEPFSNEIDGIKAELKTIRKELSKFRKKEVDDDE